MRNRAKCKKCEDVIESKFKNDFVKCSCDEIWIDGGQEYYRAGANDYSNFLRIDEDDKEVPVRFIDDPTKEEPPVVMDMNNPMRALDDLIQRYENLPPDEMLKPITQYDQYSFLLLFREMLMT